MSDQPLQVRVVCEGPSDFYVLKAAIRHALGDHHVITKMYPEHSVGFGEQGQHGTGWKGVLGFLAALGQKTQGGWSAFWANVDLLIIHLDGEVAWESDPDPRWADVTAIQVSCPPCHAAADALWAVVQRRLGSVPGEARIIVGVPTMETEEWLIPLYRPSDLPDECRPKPSRLFAGGQPKLVEQGGKKRIGRYRELEEDMAARWASVLVLDQARRFHERLVVLR